MTWLENPQIVLTYAVIGIVAGFSIIALGLTALSAL